MAAAIVPGVVGAEVEVQIGRFEIGTEVKGDGVEIGGVVLSDRRDEGSNLWKGGDEEVTTEEQESFRSERRAHSENLQVPTLNSGVQYGCSIC